MPVGPGRVVMVEARHTSLAGLRPGSAGAERRLGTSALPLPAPRAERALQGSVMIPRIVSTDAKIPSSLIGAAGEYLIAAELSRRGWLTTVTMKNIKPKER